MTTSKQMTGAVALLATIAVLDNFVFVESDPEFQSMVLIDTSATQSEPSYSNLNPLKTPPNFWLDQHTVSNAEFANFLQATGHEIFTLPPNTLQAHTTPNGDFTAIVGDDRWANHASASSWHEPVEADSLALAQPLAGQGDLRVSFIDGRAYCNWRGKELPTAEQFSYLSSEDGATKHPQTLEFRCAKNIAN